MGAWAGRLLGERAAVLEASGSRVAVLILARHDIVISAVGGDRCACVRFRRVGRCRHTKALLRMRTALTHREQQEAVEELRRLAARA